ncbi:acyltransferase [Curtobacterium sp. VKM Ac-2865]|uniref:acyltransferase family protein n=1 Tax=Curtobacterium sp. VKM Ac-2865 TaxID=2783817 RepID=UPI00188B2931|nr:acyltransferase [Curtobacterium sp. VKM Ac-2865]MBF4583325.1 acyltransferase [Curtobacterium sp. VKM Ac-2865]
MSTSTLAQATTTGTTAAPTAADAAAATGTTAGTTSSTTAVPAGPLAHRATALDGLRTVAILIVMLYHLHVAGFEGGFIGVQVFFVLSGFLITSLLLGEQRRTGRIRLGSFWVKRLLRLYPALLVMVAAGIALWSWVGDYKGASFSAGEAALIALTYTGNLFRSFWDTTQGVFGHTWSLSMEEQFYLVWPPVLVLLFAVRAHRRALTVGLGVVVVGASIASWASYRTPGGGATPDVYFSPVLGLVPLATGCLLALLLDDERVRAWAAGVAGHVGTWVGLGLLATVQVAIGDDWGQHAWTFGLLLPATGVVSALLIGGLVSVRTPVSVALSWRPVAWFGRRVSYAAYLWHPLVIALLGTVVSGIAGDFAWIWLLGTAILVAVGAAYAVEVPIERLRRRFREARRLLAAERSAARVAE